MKIKYVIVCLFSLAFSISSSAHTDRILKQEGDNLVGLSEEFTPAKFNWENETLRIGQNTIDLSAFENIIPMQQEYEIYITSSWYHKSSTLPPYIGINLKPKDRTFSYTILLNLETLELIKVTMKYRIHEEKFNQTVFHELKIRDSDLRTIKYRTRTTQ